VRLTSAHSGLSSVSRVTKAPHLGEKEQAMLGTISPWPVIQNGYQGHPVKTVQFLLREPGHHVAVDGVFGPATEAAVKSPKTTASASSGDGGCGVSVIFYQRRSIL
jgi:peptidoglycan hydrolase-like protein with peptidoglycan-binding domain